jgi:hypothetical protein
MNMVYSQIDVTNSDATDGRHVVSPIRAPVPKPKSDRL